MVMVSHGWMDAFALDKISMASASNQLSFRYHWLVLVALDPQPFIDSWPHKKFLITTTPPSPPTLADDQGDFDEKKKPPGNRTFVLRVTHLFCQAGCDWKSVFNLESLPFRFKAGGNGKMPTAVANHSHRPTTKVSHKPFKSKAATKHELRDRAKGMC